MKKIFFAFAIAAGLFSACTSDDLGVVVNPTTENEVPISFGSIRKGMTRADYRGADAAKLLGNQFVVSGYKGSATGTVGNIVFDNYVVKYKENTANTTESNSSNWEYVGVDRIKHAIDNGITSQTIKYWDYSQAQYDFIAWSTGDKTAIYEKPSTGIPAGSVLVSAITPATAFGAWDPTATTNPVAYTFSGTAADLANCYIADLVTIKKSETDPNKPKYQDVVTFKFRQLGTKVRIALYETVPGYSVKDVQFYSAAASNDASAAAAKLFTTTANDINTEGTYTVYYPTVDNTSSEDNNQAHVHFEGAGSQSTTIDWGKLNYTIREEGEKSEEKIYLGRSSSTASYAGNADNNYYVVYLPNETGTNLNLRVNYTLESIDGSGEVINVKGATAQVPSIYTTWKPGFAYTYIFKISDKTNGHTGLYDPTQPDNTTINSDPAGLYPITFDAVVVNAEDKDATQETITLVSTPSITTYQKGSTVVNNNEYVGSTGPIFVTVNDGNSATTPDLANGKLVKLTTANAALYTVPAGKTEAEVIDALQMQVSNVSGVITGRSGLVLTPAANDIVTSVDYGVDGNAIDLTSENASAMKFTGSANTYAFVYTKSAPNAAGTIDKFQPVTKAAGANVEGFYRYAYANAGAGDAQKGVKYFSLDAGVYTMENAFIGQGVGNLYLDAAGTTIASGYAATGTDYYYTTNNGLSYTKATNIAYDSFKTTTLYKDPALSTPKTEASPVDGQAYYDTTGAYCVILPQQTDSWYVLDEAADKEPCTTGETAIDGQTYFDKYTQNNGVYYTKVIKVQ